MLRFILGGSGQGKTHHIMQEMIERSKKEPGQKLYLIVPEQYSLQMQRDMVMAHPNKGFFHIDVQSFFRLSYLILDELNIEPEELLEDLGVSMILKKIISRHQEEFTYFKRSIRKQGFLDELKSMIMEFISYGVTEEMLSSMEEESGEHRNLSSKCRELALIYSYFNQEIEGQYLLMEQILSVMTRYAEESKLLKEGIFYFDGFTGFTPIQLKFMEKLLMLAKEVVCSVTIPYNPMGKKNRQELFHFSEKTIESLVSLCKKNQISIGDPLLLDKEIAPRYQAEDLAFLEKNILRPERHSYAEEPEHIHVIACQNPEDEAEYILHKIEELVRQKGYRYRDIAVLTGNEEEYIPSFLRQSESMQIPLFVDANRMMTYQAGVESVRALFYLAKTNYSYESVFRYLKSGMSQMQEESVDFLENYVIEAGVRGYHMWREPFRRRLFEYDEDQQTYLDALRKQLLIETESFYLVWKDADSTVEKKLKVLLATLEKLEYEEKFETLSQIAGEEGRFDEAREYGQFYSVLCELIDKTWEIFGEETFTVGELSDILDAGLESLGITVAPLSVDQVILGDLKRSRLPEIKVLFITGVNDTYLPPLPVESGLISDDEKNLLKDYGIELSMTSEEQVLENEFYMYLSFSKPKEELYFTYAAMGNDGGARRESEVIKHLQRIFPALRSVSYPQETGRKYVSWNDSRAYLCDNIRNFREKQQVSRAFPGLLQYGYMDPAHREEISMLWDTWLEKKGFEAIDPELARELTGSRISGSVTRLESFMQCPYQFFCSYGLNLKERKEYEVSHLDYGSALHSALDYFSKKVKESAYSWKNIPQNEMESWQSEAVDHALGERLSEVLQETARNRYKRQTIERMVARTISVISEQLKNGDFEPDHFELHFGGSTRTQSNVIPLSEDRQMLLQGSIDRVDLYEEDDTVYLKIIDYKSGNKELDLNQVYQGIQMQLVVYMNSAVEHYAKESGKKVVPAGIYYYHIQDPILKTEDYADEDKIQRQYQMKGYSNSDPAIINHIEASTNPRSIQVSINRNGSLSKRSKVMETEDFYAMGDHIKKKLAQAGRRIMQGEIDARPYHNGKTASCGYCKFRSICGFDPKVRGYEYQEHYKMGAEDILKDFRKQVD